MPRCPGPPDTRCHRFARTRLRHVRHTARRRPARQSASPVFGDTDPCSLVPPGVHDNLDHAIGSGRWRSAAARAVEAAPARAKQGQQFNQTPQQGAADGKCGTGNVATRHGVSSFESMDQSWRLRHTAGSAGSEIVELPDHHPAFVKYAFDVTEEAVDVGLHGVFLVRVVADGTTIAHQCCSRFSRR